MITFTRKRMVCKIKKVSGQIMQGLHHRCYIIYSQINGYSSQKREKHACSDSLKVYKTALMVTLHGTNRNDDFQRKRALQHFC